MKNYKLKSILYFESKSKHKAGEGKSDGLYPFYTSSLVRSKWINEHRYEDDSLIFGTGGKASIHFESEKFSTSTDCFVAKLKDEYNKFNLKFVYYFLFGNIHLLEKGFKGAGLKHISKKYIEEIDIPAIAFEEQNKIVSVLDIASQLIQQRKDSIALLDELLVAKFLDMFGDPIINKNNWNESRLQDISLLQRGKFSARPRNDPSYFDGKHPFIQTGDISNSQFRLDTYTQTLNCKGVKVSREFKKGTIVIAIVGATIGATAILMLDTYATDSVIGIKADSKINNVFLEMVLRFYRQVLKDKAPEGDKPNINLAILNPLKIILPPLKLQEEFAFISDKIEKQRKKILAAIEVHDELFLSIIQKAYNGQLNFDVSLELDALLETINLDSSESKSNLSLIANDLTYLVNLVDRLNEGDFKSKKLYEKAKLVAFQLLKEDEFISQVYDKKSQSLGLVLK